MQNWLFSNPQALGKVLFSTFLLFTILLVLVRILGLRSFAKMTSIDFASTIAIGSVLASTLLSDSPSILKGGVAIASILLFQTLFSKLTLRIQWVEKIVNNQPLLLMDGEKILYENLHAVNLKESALLAKLREANVIERSEIHAVVFESTGDISVLHSRNKKELWKDLMKNVRKSY
ncbi:MAG: YetF domain-containing protein [Bacteroidota bacterium]